MANPRGQQRDKPFRDALRMESKLADDGEATPAKPGSLRYIARQLLIRAGEETAAAKEVGDRLDGKPAQAIIGGDEGDEPIKHVLEVSWKSKSGKSKSTTAQESSSSASTTESSDGQSLSPIDEPEKP